MAEPRPGPPEAAGMASRDPERLTSEEGARVLAAQARDRLRDEGFTDDEITEWAETFIAEMGSGDVTTFVNWVAERQAGTGSS